MATTNSPDRWEALKQEALAVLGVAGSLTAALWIKRTFERLTSSKLIDPHIVQNGLKPPAAPTPQPTSSYQDRSLYGSSLTSNWYNSLHRQHRSGPGSVWIDTVGDVRYRSKVQTSDGYTLYDHDEEINPYQITNCPLLKTTACDNCEWMIGDGAFSFDPQCAAKVKLREEPREGMSLNAVRSHLEGSQ